MRGIGDLMGTQALESQTTNLPLVEKSEVGNLLATFEADEKNLPDMSKKPSHLNKGNHPEQKLRESSSAKDPHSGVEGLQSI